MYMRTYKIEWKGEGERGGKCTGTIYSINNSSRNNIDTRYRVVMYVAHLKRKI